MNDETPLPAAPHTGRWQPGQSGNPKGRPKKKPITMEFEALFNEMEPMKRRAFVRGIFEKAAQGDVAAFKEIADRVEGKVAQPVGGSEELGPVQVTWKQSK